MATSSNQMYGSSLSLSIPSYFWSVSHDVYLSFRSIDTGKMFVDPLCKLLNLDGIQTFFHDSELKESSSLLLREIGRSKIIIVVLSINYASSVWCLDELVQILKSKRTGKQSVIPIFYHVDPSDVSHQTGEFGTAFQEHTETRKKGQMRKEFGKKFLREKVQAWKAALTEIGNLSGYHLPNLQTGLQLKLISEIVKTVGLDMTKYRVKKIWSLHRLFRKLLRRRNSLQSNMNFSGLEEVWSLPSLKFSDWTSSLRTNPYGVPGRLLFSLFPNIVNLSLRGDNLSGISHDSIGLFGRLSLLNLTDCESLTKLPDSISKLRSLQRLNLSGCTNLADIPESIDLPQSLSSLDLTDCISLTQLPQSITRLRSLINLSLAHCQNLAKIPKSIASLESLLLLDLTNCKSLTKLPKSISNLRSLQYLYLPGCSRLIEVPTGLNDLESPRKSHADEVSISTLSTASQAVKMEVKLDRTLFDIKVLLGLMKKVSEYKLLRPKFVAVMNLKVMHIRNSKLPQIPDNLSFPDLIMLSLKSNHDLIYIPSSFFEKMPALKVLDMSNTHIKSLPPSVFKLIKLEKLLLRRCELLTELPHEIGALGNLKVLDLEGTDLVCLPEELGELFKIKCLRVSLYDAETYRKCKEIVAIIPRSILSKLTQLEELSINVDPHDTWCNAAVEAIMEALPSLRRLKTLKLYLPTAELLKDLLELKWNTDDLPIYQNLSNFNFIIGAHAQRFISRLPCDLEDEFLKLKKCLKYINGEDTTTKFAGALKHAKALYLDRHWTIQKLSVFKLEELNELKFCLLVDCNEMQTVFNGSDFNLGIANKGDNLLSLQYLAIHYLKNLKVIWKGPGVGCCLHFLKILALHMCPELTTIFTPEIVGDLVNLNEVIVEDCPKIRTLLAGDLSQLTSKEILPRLKKLSLLYLPEMVSISGDISIGPKLEIVVIYGCPKLKRLSSMGVCNKEVIEITGESEWWNDLEWSGGQPYYVHRAFSELDEDLLDQLAPQYGNSLHLFVKECEAN